MRPITLTELVVGVPSGAVGFTANAAKWTGYLAAVVTSPAPPDNPPVPMQHAGMPLFADPTPATGRFIARRPRAARPRLAACSHSYSSFRTPNEPSDSRTIHDPPGPSIGQRSSRAKRSPPGIATRIASSSVASHTIPPCLAHLKRTSGSPLPFRDKMSCPDRTSVTLLESRDTDASHLPSPDHAIESMPHLPD